MAIDIVPFSDAHLDEALALLANRHQAMRSREPLLPAPFDRPEAWRPVLEQVCEKTAATGWAATENGRLVGRLFFRRRRSPTRVPLHHVPIRWKRRKRLPRVCLRCWLQPGIATDLQCCSTRLHSDSSGRAFHGCTGLRSRNRRRIREPGIRPFSQSCHSTYGRQSARCCRFSPGVSKSGIWRRSGRAASGDEANVLHLATELWRSFTDPPILMPWIEESLLDFHNHLRKSLDDPTSPIWLAVRSGRPAAMQLFLTPESDDWFAGPFAAASGSLYLILAGAAANSRGRGTHTALLRHTMRWARDSGYHAMLLHRFSPSFAAEYWHRQGFRPVTHWMIRRIDPRSLPAIAQ